MSARAVPLLVLLVLLPCACAGPSLRRFPLREPLQQDPDQRPFSPRPEESYSSLAWDGADNLLFRPVSRFFAVDPGGEALNVNALDEVPDSSWFVNRLSRGPLSPEVVARGPCDRSPEPPWKVTRAKPDGANPGFFIEDARGDRYLLKFDRPRQPERATAADVIGARVYHAAGYHVACAQVVLFAASALVAPPPVPGAADLDPRRVVTPERVAAVLARTPRTAQGLYRANASLYVEGTPIGPWRYEGVWEEDPNDVVPHQDRRELRGSRLLAAWLNHFDAREQNTLASFIEPEEGKGGYVRHYMLDFGDTLGSLWAWDGISRRLGHAHYFDFAEVMKDFLGFGLARRPWDRARLGPAGEPLGYFDVERFEPENWKPGYPNPAFSRMTEADAAWMARILARFGDAHVEALVDTGRFENRVVRDELLRILLGRRDALLAHYLERRSPLTLPRLVEEAGRQRLCLEDLVVSAGRAGSAPRAYRARAWSGERLRPLPPPEVRPRAPGEPCVALPPQLGGSAAKPEYLVLDVEAGAPGAPPARVHLYHLGEGRFRVVGLERPGRADAPRP